jgi:hypothetical protein
MALAVCAEPVIDEALPSIEWVNKTTSHRVTEHTEADYFQTYL